MEDSQPQSQSIANFLMFLTTVEAGSLAATPAQTINITTFQLSLGSVLPKLWKSAFFRSASPLFFAHLSVDYKH